MPFDAVSSISTSFVATDRLSALAWRARVGDRRAKGALLCALAPTLRRLVLAELTRASHTLPAADVDDVVQELLIGVWQQDLERFDPTRGPFLSFVRRRVRWRLLDAVRSLARCRTEPLESDDAGEPAQSLGSEEQGPEHRLEMAERERRLLVLPGLVERALEGFSNPAGRRTITEHDLGSRPLRLVAEELGLHASSVSRARRRALRFLERRLPKAYAEAA